MPPRADPYMSQFGAALQSRFSDADRVALAAAEGRRKSATDAELQEVCRGYFKVFIRGYLADPASIARVRGDICADPPAALRNSNNVNRSVLGSLGAFDLRPGLSSVKVPSLVVHGDRDPIPLESAREWATSLGQARLLVIADSGHFPFVEQPEVFFAPVEAFLQGRWPANAASKP
jgi:proline iminopeptidase